MNSAIQHARDKGSKGKTKRAWRSAILCAANFRLDDTDASGVPLGSSRNILCAVMPVIIIIFRHGRVGFTRSVDPRSLSPLACRSSCSRRTASLHCTHIYISPHARSLPTTPPCSLVPPGGWGAAVFALSTADDPRSWPNATERLRGGAHRVSLRSRATLPSGRVAIPFST
jgi:hypothetical protein